MATKKRTRIPEAGRDTGASGERIERRAEVHAQSATAVAAEALSTGVEPSTMVGHEHDAGRDSDLLRVGDADVDPLGVALVGDEAPGGDMPTPDQSGVDDIGHAYGLAEEDDGELRPASEVLEHRDRNRYALEGPRPGRGTRGDDRDDG